MTTALSYIEHVKRAFIDPIRSVLAIDDEYPTIDRILTYDENKLKFLVRNENWSRLEKLVKFCRNREQELLIDIHDGSSHDLEHGLPLKSLRQCDWVVLDFQLNGAGGDGSRSCDILSRLAASDNFNLVTIYTQKTIDEVYKEVLLKFLKPVPIELLPKPNTGILISALDDWSDSTPEIQGKISEKVTADIYLRLIERGYWRVNPKPSCKDLLGEFYALYKQRPDPESFPVTKSELLDWAVRKFEEDHGIKDDASSPRCIAKANLDDSLKWLLVGNLFVCFIEKEIEPEMLLEKTLDCLAAWNPSPNRLALSKLRAELDASGILADNEVMNDRSLQAYWLSKLLAAEQWEQNEQVGALVSRQTELLFEKLRAKVVLYASEVLSSVDRSNIASEVARFFPGANHPNDGVLAHNTVVSTRPVGGGNLVPGHILKLDDTNDSSDLWICLSPACDLVPCRQGGRDLKTRLNGWMPFTAVKLFKIPAKEALVKANQGHVLFIRHDSRLEQYSIYPKGSLSSNPVWEEFFAKNEGVFEQGKPVLSIAQLQGIELRSPVAEPLAESIPEGSSNFKIFSSRVVSQLRGEYAVNLTQKLSTSMTRVGLDYSDS